MKEYLIMFLSLFRLAGKKNQARKKFPSRASPAHFARRALFL
ncbi:MAG: hypothetical protein ACLVMF_05215 [Christensenellales bacterium]